MNPAVRNCLYGLIILAGAGGAGYMLFGRTKENVAVNAAHFSVDGMCLACKSETKLSVPREEEAPHRCPKCGQQAVYPLWYCEDCKKRFVPVLERRDPNGPPRMPVSVACPNCRGQSVAPYIPEAQLETPAGDQPLPPWP